MLKGVRRTNYEPRIEMAPLLDVIFLLLTFFIFSLVLSVRAELVPVSLPAIASGEAAERGRVVAITVDRSGAIFVNGEATTESDLEGRLLGVKTAMDDAKFYLAMDGELGELDRLPLFMRVIDILRRVGIEDFSLVGKPVDGGG